MRNRIKAVAFAVIGGAALVLPASAPAAFFGADLDPQLQPSNAGNGHFCFDNDHGTCTRVLMDAYQNAGHEKAPKDGTIKKIKIIANSKGSFRLQIAKARASSNRAKIVRDGPRLSYDGQPDSNEPYVIEKFNVNVKVNKGEYLAVKARKVSFLRCSSGGDNQLLFQPPLPVGGNFKNADGTDGCWLLMEAVYG